MFLLGATFPYLALAVFLLGLGWRTARWLQRPVPFSLAISPTGAGPGRQAAAVAKELLLLVGLLRGDRRLWLTAWLMHGSLALILIGHLVGIPCQARQFCYLGASPETSVFLSTFFGTAAGAVFAACLVVLAARRMASPELRRLSDPGDYLVLAMLFSVAVTGLAMRWVAGEAELAAVRGYLGGLLTFRPGPLPDSTLFLVHFTLVNILLVYFPFSKLAHLTGGIIGRLMLLHPTSRTQDRSVRTSREPPRDNDPFAQRAP